MLIPLLLVLIALQWFAVKRSTKNHSKIIFYAASAVVLSYVLIRMAGYYGRFIVIDFFVAVCLAVVIGFPVEKFIRKRFLKTFLLVLTIILVNFSLVVHGFLTVDRWMWDDWAVKFRLRTDGGNIVAIQGCDAGGLDYTKYSFRKELLWGAFFKEYDEKRVYEHHKEKPCLILLKNDKQLPLRVNICEKRLEQQP